MTPAGQWAPRRIGMTAVPARTEHDARLGETWRRLRNTLIISGYAGRAVGRQQPFAIASMRLHLGIVALLLPVSLGAQQPAAPPASTNPIAETFRGFGYYGGWLIAAFDSIPAGKYEFKPTPPQQSIGYIAQHLESANYGLCEVLGGTKHARTAKDSLADTVKAKWPKDTLVARLRASLIFCRDALAPLTDAQLAGEITVHFPGNPERRAPRVRYAILLFTDLAEHYAQLASYMRQLGMVPPSALRK
jgi:uncharacterized damage-inducible protein DinB